MPVHKITTVEKLREYLHTAMQLEHATIPPYLLALYSIHPGTNPDATQVIRVVAVEEMLHLTLAANLLNAVGGTPDLTAPNFVPAYPAYLPDGEQDFLVDLQMFSMGAIETFLQIERPKPAPSEEKRTVERKSKTLVAPRNHRPSVLAASPENDGFDYYSIGEFYEEIRRGLVYLHGTMGDSLFPPTGQSRQVTSEYYYSGGGELIPVTDLHSALKAIRLIVEQGEGLSDKIYGEGGELAHDYRFEQLKLGQYYMPDDNVPGKPSGPKLQVDWDAAYPIKKNAKLTDYAGAPELYAAALAFNQSYADFLALLTTAFNGQPELLLDAVPAMFNLRNKILQLIHNPIPGMDGVNAAPTFEMPNTPPPPGADDTTPVAAALAGTTSGTTQMPPASSYGTVETAPAPTEVTVVVLPASEEATA